MPSSWTPNSLNTHLARINVALEIALQSPGDPRLQELFAREVEGITHLRDGLDRGEPARPTLLLLSAVSECIEARNASRAINFEAIREDDQRIDVGWRAAATSGSPKVDDLGETAGGKAGEKIAIPNQVPSKKANPGGAASIRPSPLRQEEQVAEPISPNPAADAANGLDLERNSNEEVASLSIEVQGQMISPIICGRCTEMRLGCYVNPSANLACVACRLTKRACSLVPKKPVAEGGKPLLGALGRKQLIAELEGAQSSIDAGTVQHPQAGVPPSQTSSSKSFSAGRMYIAPGGPAACRIWGVENSPTSQLPQPSTESCFDALKSNGAPGPGGDEENRPARGIVDSSLAEPRFPSPTSSATDCANDSSPQISVIREMIQALAIRLDLAVNSQEELCCLLKRVQVDSDRACLLAEEVREQRAAALKSAGFAEGEHCAAERMAAFAEPRAHLDVTDTCRTPQSSTERLSRVQNEDTEEDVIVITALNVVPFCCHADLITMNRAELLVVANTLNAKLPHALQIDVSPSRSDSVPQAPKPIPSHLLIPGLRGRVPPSPASPLAMRSRSNVSIGSPALAMLREEDEDVPSAERPRKKRRLESRTTADAPTTPKLDLAHCITRSRFYNNCEYASAPDVRSRLEVESRRHAEERAEQLRDDAIRMQRALEEKLAESGEHERKARECFAKLGMLFMKAAKDEMEVLFNLRGTPTPISSERETPSVKDA
ncbi:hypothetical protein A0H81_02874 [Grifola frondosa]|uniref:Uncharacterized protein n=1 Tax=Grifola frondosa TaxID=5627 RepID=A0A1C7MNM7_GRIFR|nr:hypothetical protein A0H81_02874 [Grifola frondosa]